jgi:hypothetical protein
MTDQPPVFTDNPMNPLEVALYEGLADHRKMGLFERLMLQSDLYAAPEAGGPGGTPGDDGPKVLRQGEQLILKGVVLNDGRNSVTLFTDPRRVTRMFGEDARILAMKGRNLLALLGEMPAILNPDGGRGLLLNPEQVRALLEIPAPTDGHVRPTGTVELSDVPEASRPQALMVRLQEVLKEVKVDAAWLARANWMEALQLGWHLDVRTEVPANEIVALARRAVDGLAFGGEVFDVAVSKPGGPDGTGIRLI